MSQDLEHQHLGHPSSTKMHLMLPSFSNSSSFQCMSCQLGKHIGHTYGTQVNKSISSPFVLVHSDIWGPRHNTFSKLYHSVIRNMEIQLYCK